MVLITCISGLQVVTPFGAKVFKGHLLMAPLDLPARAMVTNMKQFNGRYACVFCHDQGETNQKQIRYPFNEACEMRTHQSILDDAGKAMQNRKPVRTNIIFPQYTRHIFCESCFLHVFEVAILVKSSNVLLKTIQLVLS